MHFEKIIVKNYKCFDDNGCELDNLKQINIIIGKNNSGKSSLIEVIKFLCTKHNLFFQSKRNGKSPEILFEHIFDKELIENSFERNSSSSNVSDYYAYGLTFDKSTLKYRITENNSAKEFVDINKYYFKEATPSFNRYLSSIKHPFEGKAFCHLSAERDIQLESHIDPLNLSISGVGATNLIQQFINRDIYDSDLIEKVVLSELNKIINPDIEFSRILVQQDAGMNWEVYFENGSDGKIPLSKMGSGVKTVLLVLLMLYVKPVVEGKKIDEYVFAFEELENNLHPSLQRRLYYYLFEFSKKNNCILFITTHSNIVIDLYNSLESSQIFHLNKVDGVTKISSILEQSHLKKILDDLDVRASDILQSNGIIWVEGPSDRVYVNKWIKLVDETLIEGYHYSIMFYGGRLLSNISFDYNLINNELIPLLKLNTNSFVIMDRDGKTISTKLNDTKTRIQEELGDDNIWITKGREIENYLFKSSLENWLRIEHSINCIFDNEINTKIEDNIAKIKNAKKIKYNLDKNRYSTEISQYIDLEGLQVLDLNDRIRKLVKIIREWNKI